jgi:uncharacterized protein (DUF1778 family)
MEKPPIDAPNSASQEPKKEKKKNNKETVVRLRVDENELKRLKEAAAHHKNISDFIRFSCLKPEKKNIISSKEMDKKLENLTKEMNAVGKNINQIARYVNFLELTGIPYAPAIDRFNHEILAYTALQIRIEAYYKQLLKA